MHILKVQLLLNAGFSKQVKQKVSGTSLQVQTLEEEVTYLVTVRAQTIDYGPAISANVTTGPQDGSPTRPKELVLGKTVSSVDMHWINGASGKGPILGYYIQSKRKGKFSNLFFQLIAYYCNVSAITLFYLCVFLITIFYWLLSF